LIESFVGLVRASSVVGKLQAAGAKAVPFNTSVPIVTAGGTYKWAGQGAPKVVGNMQPQSASLPISKAAGIIVVSSELVKLASPSAETLVRNELTGGIASYLDQQFTDPTIAAVASVSPASITNGAPSIGSSGTSSANAATDLKLLLSTFFQFNPNAASVALICSPATATALSIATNSQTCGPNGGTLMGVPVITGSVGNKLIAVDPSQVLIADDGALDVTVSTQGTVEFDTLPTSPITAGSVLVSLWQANLTGFKVDRLITWKTARPSAVVYSVVAYA